MCGTCSGPSIAQGGRVHRYARSGHHQVFVEPRFRQPILVLWRARKMQHSGDHDVGLARIGKAQTLRQKLSDHMCICIDFVLSQGVSLNRGT